MSEPSATPTHARGITLDTYRYLRGGMVITIVMLAAAVFGERWTATCWEASISAYYFTTAHGIFIAALCALGAQLIVYKGSSDTEDVLLNLAGVLAFIVAMVPTARSIKPCGMHDLPKYELQHGITNNVRAVIIALVAAQIVLWLLHRRAGTKASKSVLGTVSLWITWAVIALFVLALVFFRARFDSNAHGAAAAIMFLAIIVTVCATAFIVKHQDTRKSPHWRGYYRAYQMIAVGMILTLAVVVVLHFAVSNWSHWVIVVETLLIGEFAAYWVIQTIELWRTPDRIQLLREADQPKLEQRRSTRGPINLLRELRDVRSEGKAPREERLLRAL